MPTPIAHHSDAWATFEKNAHLISYAGAFLIHVPSAPPSFTSPQSWHRSQPYGILVKHYDQFIGVSGSQAKSDGAHQRYRVLVPLCGKTLDMPFLADKGHEVVGVEGCETAAWQLQRDAWLKFQVSQHASQGVASDGQKRFIAAPTFGKKRTGYVFKTDEQGTGYYLDAKPLKVTPVEEYSQVYITRNRSGTYGCRLIIAS